MRLQKNLGSNLDLPLSGCVTLSKTFSFSKPWISDPKIEDNSILRVLILRVGRMRRIMHVKALWHIQDSPIIVRKHRVFERCGIKHTVILLALS